MLPTESLNAQPFCHVPNTDGTILRVRDDQLMAWMEQHARHIVGVAAHGIYFPSLGFIHSPQFHLHEHELRLRQHKCSYHARARRPDAAGLTQTHTRTHASTTVTTGNTCLAIVSTGHNQGQCVMKGCPVCATVVTLKHILDNSIISTKQVSVHTCSEAVIITTCRWSTSHRLLAEAGRVPNTNGLIKRRRHNLASRKA